MSLINSGGRSRGGFGNRDGGNRGYGGGGNRNGGDGDRGFGGGGGGFRGGNRGRRNDDDGEANDDAEGGFGGGNRGGGRRDFGDRNGGGGRRDFGEGKRDFGGGNREDRQPDENGNFGDEKPREFYIPPEPSTDEAEIFNTGITSGINFSKYDKIPVKVSGDNPAPAITSFEEAGMRDLVMGNITKSGYTVPTPIQKTAIPIISNGRDLMACAQTGSGKTAAFLLPIINKLLSDNDSMQVGKPHALVVSPTRELAIQIFNEARKFSLGSFLKISIVYGGTSSKHQSEMVSRGSHILICTPGRLLDFVNRGYLSFEETRFVVLDEADRMLDMGFKEDINKVMKHPTMRPVEERQTLMFSATFPSEIQRMAGEYLNNYIFITIGIVGGACSDVEQNIVEVQKHQKRNKLLELLGEKADGSIVFVETKRNADFLASVLSDTEFPTTSIHGDRLQSQREIALAEFKSGRMKVLIATSVAARGLDIRNVRHVINYDLPTNIDDYVHRIGRTGRVGNKGKATSFYDPEKDSALGGPLVKILQDAGQEIPEFLQLYVGASAGCFSDSGFGGRDVRGQDKGNGGYDGPSALEPEEAWD